MSSIHPLIHPFQSFSTSLPRLSSSASAAASRSSAAATLRFLIFLNGAVLVAWNLANFISIERKIREKRNRNFDDPESADESEYIESESDAADSSFMRRHFTVSRSGVFERRRFHTLITAAFSHSSYSHFTGNMTSLYLFGIPLHLTIGRRWFMLLYLAGGIFSNLVWISLEAQKKKIQQRRAEADREREDEGAESEEPESCSLGASGAVSSIITCFALMRPLYRLQIWGTPIPALAYATAFIGIEFLYSVPDLLNKLVSIAQPNSSFRFVNPIADGVAHSSHWAGSLLGICAGFYIRQLQGRPMTIRELMEIVKQMRRLIEQIAFIMIGG